MIKDARLSVSEVKFDQISLEQILIDKSEYRHDFNGTTQAQISRFYGEMGCNGQVVLKFTAPVYLWLLESM